MAKKTRLRRVKTMAKSLVANLKLVKEEMPPHRGVENHIISQAR